MTYSIFLRTREVLLNFNLLNFNPKDPNTVPTSKWGQEWGRPARIGPRSSRPWVHTRQVSCHTQSTLPRTWTFSRYTWHGSCSKSKRGFATYGNTKPNKIDGILQYYQALSYHKRKTYLHASLLKKDIKAVTFQNMTYSHLKQLLERAENLKFYLDRIHEKLSNFCTFSPGQSKSRTCGNSNLETGIVFLEKATDLALYPEVEPAETEAARAQQNLDATLAQIDAWRMVQILVQMSLLLKLHHSLRITSHQSRLHRLLSEEI